MKRINVLAAVAALTAGAAFADLSIVRECDADKYVKTAGDFGLAKAVTGESVVKSGDYLVANGERAFSVKVVVTPNKGGASGFARVRVPADPE